MKYFVNLILIAIIFFNYNQCAIININQNKQLYKKDTIDIGKGIAQIGINSISPEKMEGIRAGVAAQVACI